MAHEMCNAVIFILASVMVQASQCSNGGDCPGIVHVSLLQTRVHTSEGVDPSKANEEVMSSASKFNEEVVVSPSKPELLVSSSKVHEDVASSASNNNSELMSLTLTNEGTFTLQGRRWLHTQGIPMSCAIPICDRKCSHGVECCATQMFEALSEITSWMDSNNVEYVVLFGTLLGARREQDIIQWTGDLDIGIYSKDVAKLEAQKDIPFSFGYQDSFGIPRGCENHHPGFPGNYSEFNMVTTTQGAPCAEGDPSCSYYVDLYVLDDYSHGEELAKKCVASSKGTDGHVKRTHVEIRGQQFYAPSEVVACLEKQYGADWKTPDAQEGFHGR